MKRHLIHLATTLLAASGLLLAACSDSETNDGGELPTPNFPEKVTKTVDAGATCEIQIDPNQDWEVTIPTTGETAKWFWIVDGSQTVYKLSGNAGKATITIGVSPLEEFDSERTCEVTMKMGPESRVIATITRSKLDRGLSVYTCMLQDGDFLFNTESGDDQTTYAYGEEPASTVELLWPEGRTGFMYPIKVEANFEWYIAEKPEWIKNMSVNSGTAGKWVEIRLEGDKTKYPLDGDAGKLLFHDRDNEEVTYEFGVSIPACRDIFRISGFGAESKFNHKGEYFNPMNNEWVEGVAMGQVQGINGSKVYIFSEVKEQWGDTYLSPEAEHTDWITLEEQPWDTTPDGGVVQERKLNVGAKENPGEARTGIVIALPASVAETVSDPYQLIDQQVKEEYKQYIATTLIQSEAPGSIAAVNPTGMALIGTAFEKLPASDWIIGQFGVGDGYKLTYTKAWSNDPEAALSVTDTEKPYTGIACYDYDLNEMTPEASWLTVRNTDDGFIVDMDPDKDPTAESSMQTEGIAHMGFVVFSNADGKFAVIQCIYDENIQIGGGDQFSLDFSYPELVSGATLVHITSENLEEISGRYPDLRADFEEQLGMGTPIYMLQYTSASPNTATLKASATFASIMVMPMSGAEWLTYEAMGETELMVNMEKPTSDQVQTGMVQLLDNGWNIKAIVYCDPAF